MLTGETVEKAAGTVELRKELFFGAKFPGMRDERAAGASRGMLDVEHLVIEDVFDDELRNGRMIHAAIEKNLIGAGIVTTELASPGPSTPTQMWTSKAPIEELPV